MLQRVCVRVRVPKGEARSPVVCVRISNKHVAVASLTYVRVCVCACRGFLLVVFVTLGKSLGACPGAFGGVFSLFVEYNCRAWPREICNLSERHLWGVSKSGK